MCRGRLIVVVEHNIAFHCNRRAGSYNAGIWPWSTDNSLFQFSGHARRFGRRGLDSDFNSRETLFQYNYSHDNEGGFMLICTPGKRDPSENIGNTGTEIRYNISRNDHARGSSTSAPRSGPRVHDNFVYVRQRPRRAGSARVRLGGLGQWRDFPQ